MLCVCVHVCMHAYICIRINKHAQKNESSSHVTNITYVCRTHKPQHQHIRRNALVLKLKCCDKRQKVLHCISSVIFDEHNLCVQEYSDHETKRHPNTLGLKNKLL